MCEKENGRKNRRYQLRYAAGLYWLIDMEQTGKPYISPTPLNEGGAELWRLIDNGTPVSEICRRMCDEYDITPEQAEKDVQDFIGQLRSKRIEFGGFE